jgi:hypothetical protein
MTASASSGINVVPYKARNVIGRQNCVRRRGLIGVRTGFRIVIMMVIVVMITRHVVRLIRFVVDNREFKGMRVAEASKIWERVYSS